MAYRDVRNGPPTNGYASDQHSSSSAGADVPSYVVEHLATFTVSPQTGLVYPVDGMRRLLQMEKSTGIWTQRMLLRLDPQWLIIQDHENGELVEKFPMSLIRDPNAFVSNDPRDIYNNILIFIVAEDAVHQIPPEMHIFQCIRIAAEEVADDLKMYMSGKSRTPVSHPARQPPPLTPTPVNAAINAAAHPAHNGAKEFGGMIGARGVVQHDDASSISSERYERDVHVLNRCFDDIERFVARLQMAAAAGRELDRRRKSRKSKKKETGDGMLSIRAKLPTEMEFADVLQKFKLSFNLLAKLRAHIHDPNAPELVHFLFSPLSLIVEASQDPGFPPNLPSRVVSPLLTQDAIELLLNCLTSKETELWNSLGDPWNIPRNKWNGYVVPYVPVFSDGWSPDPSFVDEKEPKRSVGHPESSRFSSDLYYDSDRGGSPQSDIPRRSRSPTGDRDAGRLRGSNRSDISTDSTDRNADAAARFERQQRQYLAELKARNARTVQVTYPRTANNDKELTVVRGEYLEILDSSRKWWKARNMRNQIGHVPNTIVTPIHEEDWQRHGSGDDLSEDEDGLPVARKNPKKAKNPKNGAVPPPPPPMPPLEPKSSPSTAANTLKRTSNISRAHSQSDMMFEELKEVIQQFSNNSRLDIRKTPDAYISSSSSPAEVQLWLKAKEFDVVIQKRLKGMNGAEVFALKREQLEKFFGKEEGHRLFSQLTIQRNTSGFKTTRSTELRQALQRARERAEGANRINGKSDDSLQANHNGRAEENSQSQQSDSDDDEVFVPTGTLRDVIRKQRKKIQERNS